MLQLNEPALAVCVRVQFMFDVSIDGTVGVVIPDVSEAEGGMKEGLGLFIMR